MTPTKRKTGTVMVFGCFDGIHAGHNDLFEKARKHGYRLLAVVARDCNVNGKKLIHSESERLALIANNRLVDEAVLGDEKDFYAVIKRAKPGVIVVGYDQECDFTELRKKIKEFGLKTRVVKLRSGYAPERCKSSRLRKALRKSI